MMRRTNGGRTVWKKHAQQRLLLSFPGRLSGVQSSENQNLLFLPTRE